MSPKQTKDLLTLSACFFLFHITVDWDDEEQRAKETATSPPKVYFRTARVILESLSSVLPPFNLRPGAGRRGRKGIAAKYHLTHITPWFLAYVAVVTRFAVSTEETFSDGGGISAILTSKNKFSTILKPLCFKLRPRKLFPNSIYYGDVAGGAGEVRDGMLWLLEAELEADDDRTNLDD
ncbi:unnamed protein product [Rhizoctonia solani]|uniref:HAT C-terminal dimerisation domain-containing protein n=1 Tax=Rhizoctonia solani TaxID=456999 RepID=A0A8H2WCY1_9AGAM|nr:unnamed protein product [Rhizoctonia solani]